MGFGPLSTLWLGVETLLACGRNMYLSNTSTLGNRPLVIAAVWDGTSTIDCPD